MSGAAAWGRPLRVLLAKLGLDSHTIGVNVIAVALRDAGMEVIYTGLKQTPERVVEAAIEEGADVVGLSSLSAAHMQHIPRVVEGLREAGAGDKLVVVGGVIPERDAAELKRLGVAEVFTMGAQTRDIVRYLEQWWQERSA